MSGDVVVKQIAEWMAAELDRQIYLYQETVVYDIASKFGDQFTYLNANGNLAIRADVLNEFRKLTADSVVWERGSRMWRKRQDYDPAGRRQG
jgi:hypothetical protein